MLNQFTYQRAGSIKEAVEAANRPGTRILGGGTDLLGCLRDEVFSAERLVSLTGVKELKGIRARAGGGLRIGALATLAEIAGHAKVVESYAVLAQAAASAASPQLRNQGTLGGNLCQRPRCWYFRGDFHCRRKGGETCFAEIGESQFHCIFGGDRCYMVHPSDTAPALVALDAKVSIAGRKGLRTVPLATFFVTPTTSIIKENVLDPGEFVTEVLLDPPLPGTRSTYRKVRDRGAFDFATAGAAIVLATAERKIRAARVVLSGVAPIPWRSVDAEKALVGKTLDAAAVTEAAAAAVKDALPLSENEYKVPLVRGMLEETLLKLAG
ncbi:MAG: FAD binding domain-containing protein [Bryobacteraceae bacterium]